MLSSSSKPLGGKTFGWGSASAILASPNLDETQQAIKRQFILWKLQKSELRARPGLVPCRRSTAPGEEPREARGPLALVIAAAPGAARPEQSQLVRLDKAPQIARSGGDRRRHRRCWPGEPERAHDRFIRQATDRCVLVPVRRVLVCQLEAPCRARRPRGLATPLHRLAHRASGSGPSRWSARAPTPPQKLPVFVPGRHGARTRPQRDKEVARARAPRHRGWPAGGCQPVRKSNFGPELEGMQAKSWRRRARVHQSLSQMPCAEAPPRSLPSGGAGRRRRPDRRKRHV